MQLIFDEAYQDKRKDTWKEKSSEWQGDRLIQEYSESDYGHVIVKSNYNQFRDEVTYQEIYKVIKEKEEIKEEKENYKMSVYLKLAKARVMLQQKGLKKSGKNKFAGYEYFELQDFLPAINEINAELGLITFISFGTELASMTIIDAEKPEQTIVINSPMAQATLKGCHDIQNLGAVESYQRRYLYLTAYEIAEHDALDAVTGSEESGAGSYKLSDKQLGRLYAIAKSKGYTKAVVTSTVKKKLNKKTEDMTKKEYDEIVKGFESAPAKGE